MRPREQSRGQDDLFRSRLDQIIDMKRPLVRLGGLIDWQLIGRKLGDVYTDGPGQPPLPTRLMAGLAILKHMHNLSDEELTLRWVENPYFQHFCGEEFSGTSCHSIALRSHAGASEWEKSGCRRSCRRAWRWRSRPRR